jgi:hypothetical protein
MATRTVSSYYIIGGGGRLDVEIGRVIAPSRCAARGQADRHRRRDPGPSRSGRHPPWDAPADGPRHRGDSLQGRQARHPVGRRGGPGAASAGRRCRGDPVCAGDDRLRVPGGAGSGRIGRLRGRRGVRVEGGPGPEATARAAVLRGDRRRHACSLVKPPEGGCAFEASRVGVGPFTGLGRNRPVVLRPVACPNRASHPPPARAGGGTALDLQEINGILAATRVCPVGQQGSRRAA